MKALTMTKTNHPDNLTPTLTILVLPAIPAISGARNQRRKRETNHLQANPYVITAEEIIYPRIVQVQSIFLPKNSKKMWLESRQWNFSK
jgi:hypothetical protein